MLSFYSTYANNFRYDNSSFNLREGRLRNETGSQNPHPDIGFDAFARQTNDDGSIVYYGIQAKLWNNPVVFGELGTFLGMTLKCFCACQTKPGVSFKAVLYTTGGTLYELQALQTCD